MLNKIVIMGRLTRDPDVKGNDRKIVNITVAVDRNYANKDGNREADFINVVGFGKTGEFIEKYFRKGSMIVVAGRLQGSRWKDDQGNSRISWAIVAEEIQFGGPRNSETGNESSNSSTPSSGSSASYSTGSAVENDFTELEGDDEVPF